LLPWTARDCELAVSFTTSRVFARLLLILLSTAAQSGNLVAGAPESIVQSFDERGRLLSETMFRDGRKTGRHVSFWPGGAPRVRAYYREDMIEGEYRSFHKNGRLAELRRYVNGREEGLQQAWTERGELFLNFEVRNGRHYGLVNSKPCLPVEGVM
jgi:antitoxin component YwqK of YwqJK toxin-antitoxin module